MRISRKLSLMTLGILLVMLALALYIHFRLMVAGGQEELDAFGRTVGPVIEESLVYSMLERDDELLKRTLKSITEIESISGVLLVNREGIVKAGSDPAAIGGKALLGPGGHAESYRTEPHYDFFDEETFRWVQPVKNRPECHRCHDAAATNNGAIILDLSTGKLRTQMQRHIAKESLIFLGSFLIVGIAIYRFTSIIFIKRLNEVASGLRRFQQGDYGAKIVVAGSDELSRLSNGLNTMAESVAGSQKEVGQYADELLSLAVSSNVVTAVPRTENLHEAVCSLAVRELKLKMAWVGLVHRDSRDIEAVAQCGFEAGYLASVRITWDDSPAGRGPTGTAVKTRTPMVMNDMERDPAYAPWRDEAMKRGYQSSMALPLLNTDGDVLGVLNLYSGEPAYFTRKRVRLFVIFANQVASAMENRMLIELEEQRNREIAEQLRQISRSHREWQLTFDSITDYVSIHDRNFRILKANKALARHLGKDQDSIVGTRCFELFHGTCVPLQACPHRTSMEESRVVVEEILEPRTSRTLRVSIFPYHSPEGDYIGSVHIARDITEEKEREMRLIMSERLASLGQMASGIAHEINNPLASIGGCAEGLLMKVKRGKYEPAQFEEYLTIIDEEVRRCKSITTGMLSFVRKTAYERKELDVNELLDKTVEIIGFQGRFRDVEVVREYQDGQPALFGSEGELRQVFLAVMTNALDAMEDAGTLTLTTRADAENAVIRIADTGPGISQEHLQRIFDPFFTTKSEKGGTGLGLSIAHKIVVNHEGAVSVRSECGRGTEFTIVLPLDKDRT